MPDGTFNPSLSLRQSAGYEALREAAALEALVDKAAVKMRHSGLFSSTLPRPPAGTATTGRLT
jgi:hypothetical protein